MNKPTLEEFNITENDIETTKQIKRYLIGLSCLLIPIGWSLIGFEILNNSVLIPFVAFFSSPPLGTMALYYISKGILSFCLPSFRNVHKYNVVKKDYENWQIRTQELFWTSLSGSQFEQELARVYKQMGYDVELTPSSGDRGIDIILKRNNRTTIVQCKATKRPVGPAVARELYGTLIESGMDDAVLASISGCTTGVRRFITNKPIKIVTLNDIIKFQQRLDTTTL
jgi:restriction system protein